MDNRKWNEQSINQPDALEAIFTGPLNWMNLLLIGINIVVFVVLEILGDTEDASFMVNWGAAYTPYILNGEWYRLLTCMFLHFGLHHLVNNMLMLLFMGDLLEGVVGKWRYLCICVGGGIVGNLVSLYVDMKTGQYAVSAGASGVVFAVTGAIIVLMLRNTEYVRKDTIIRLILVTALMIYNGFETAGVDNAAHIGGILAGMVLMMLLYHNRV